MKAMLILALLVLSGCATCKPEPTPLEKLNELEGIVWCLNNPEDERCSGR